MGKLVLIDGNAILHRAYHAIPLLTTKKGEPINAVYGFVSMLLRIINDLKPTHLAVCFDRKEPTFRKKAFKKYQAHRPEMDKELSSQFEKAKAAIESFNIPFYEKKGYEADDLIGTLAHQVVGRQTSGVSRKKMAEVRRPSTVDQVIIVTGDKDILQLVNDKVKVYLPGRGLSNAQLMGVNGVVMKMGVEPKQIIDYKALVGDPSDNYPGVYGIGPKTAEKLLERYGTYKNIYKHLKNLPENTTKKLKEGKKGGDMSYKLAKIVTDVDFKFKLGDMGKWNVGNKSTLDFFAKYGLKTLSRRVENFGKTSSSYKPKLKKNLSKSEIEKVVVTMAKRLKNRKYAIRGTASIILQDIDMIADDIDIISDKKTALYCNKALKEYLVRKVVYSKSEKMKSYFGKFNIRGVKVEIMGEWQIKTDKKGWGQVYDASDEQVEVMDVKGKRVKVTKITTELGMFASLGRWNAYHKIKKQAEQKNQQSLF